MAFQKQQEGGWGGGRVVLDTKYLLGCKELPSLIDAWWKDIEIQDWEAYRFSHNPRNKKQLKVCRNFQNRKEENALIDD